MMSLKHILCVSKTLLWAQIQTERWARIVRWAQVIDKHMPSLKNKRDEHYCVSECPKAKKELRAPHPHH